jgi:hypothetical protein
MFIYLLKENCTLYEVSDYSLGSSGFYIPTSLELDILHDYYWLADGYYFAHNTIYSGWFDIYNPVYSTHGYIESENTPYNLILVKYKKVALDN